MFNRSRITGIVGAILFVVLIATIMLGPKECSNQEFPFWCFVTQLFRW